MARRWKAPPKGIPSNRVVKRGNWYYLKPGTQPRTTTTAPRPEQPPRRIGPPNEFIGDPGLHPGTWLKPPRLNPDQWEVAQNPDDKRYYARRVTELTGLDPGARQQVLAYDRQTEAQAQRIADVYNTSADRSVADSAAGAQALGQFAQLAGTGINPGDQTAQTLAGLNQSSVAAGSSPAAAFLANLPSLIRASGASAATNYRGQRFNSRGELISGLRESQAEAASAQNEAEYNRQRLAAQVRGDNLNLIARLTGIDADTQQALISSGTSLTNNANDNATSIANNTADNATQIATTGQTNATRLAVAQTQAGARRARGSNKPFTAADRRAWGKIVTDLSKVKRTSVQVKTGEKPVYDRDGKIVAYQPIYETQYREETATYPEILDALLNAGAPAKLALKMAQRTKAWRDYQSARRSAGRVRTGLRF